MPRASYGDRHCLTIQQDKEHVTLDFTSRVIDFFTVHSVELEKGEELPNMEDVNDVVSAKRFKTLVTGDLGGKSE